MIVNDLVLLAEQFAKLELHAARGGREVQRVLLEIASASTAKTSFALQEEIRESVAYLLGFLPPYAPPLNRINQILVCLEGSARDSLDVQTAKNQLAEIADHAAGPLLNARLIATLLSQAYPEKSVVYTHTMSETILNVLQELHRWCKISHVFVTESRPNNDGWETARRLASIGIEVSLTIDAAMPFVIEKAHFMLSGAEIIQKNGAVVGKIGAFPAAVFCCMAGKPVWIAADTGKISPFDQINYNFTPFNMEDLGIGSTIPFLTVTGSYFDITPPEYIHAIATETGTFTPNDINKVVSNQPVSTWLQERLRSGINRA